MKINLQEMTLTQVTQAERLLYVRSEYYTEEFTDIEFTDFIQDQFSTGIDPLEFEFDDETNTLIYYVDSARDQIYYFEQIIQNRIEAGKEAEMMMRAGL